MAAIAEALTYKAAGSARRVVVTGCLAQRDGESLRRSAGGIDAVVGVNNRDELPRAVMGDGEFTAIDSFHQWRQKSPGADGVGDDRGRLRLTPPHTAYLRISAGCGQGCTFCTIPAICGPFRSKPTRQVLDEARELIADGAVELNLVAQDTTSYGSDIGYTPGLAGLLCELDGLDGVRWIRLMYANPNGLSDDIIDAVAGREHVVKYLDLPLQHIADTILKPMGRRITRRRTEQLLERLRSRVKGLTLRTAFIVGFPGETDKDFRELLAFVRAFRFDEMGVFEYSKEQGTPAAKMAGEVSEESRGARREELMLAQQEIVFAANADRVGREVSVLVDGVDSEGRCVGRHAGQAPDVDSLCYLTDQRPAGSFTSAVVVGWETYDLIVRPNNTRRTKRPTR